MKNMINIRYAETLLPTKLGCFRFIVYHLGDGLEHIALVKGEVTNKSLVLARVHSECLTGEVFLSLKCDCQSQLSKAMTMINDENLGVLLYLRQEGRSIGLGNKIKAYDLQQQGLDTVDANITLGLPCDGRNFNIAAKILRDLGVLSIKLLTNNPEKMEALINAGIHVVERLPLIVEVSDMASDYMNTKAKRLGHIIPHHHNKDEDHFVHLDEVY